MLQLIPRSQFEKAVSAHNAERHCRGFSSWSHFVAMMFGQLCGQDSLRGIEAGLASQPQCLHHIGVKRVKRATLSYANAHRPHEVFRDLFLAMLSKCTDKAPRHKFKFKNKLYSLDATVIDLCLSMYNWAKFRTTKGAIKLHVKLNHAGYLPSFAIMTEGKTHEQTAAWDMSFEKGDVVVFDRGYNSFKWLQMLENTGVFFVTRLKSNADYSIVDRDDVSNQEFISSDQIIKMDGFYSKQNYPGNLRRIRSIDPETNKPIELLTNNFNWSPATIAAIYKDRWQIELFFKSLKQQLKVKSFVGTSKNALLSQLWTALIAYLLLSYLKYVSRFKWSVYTLCAIMPANLFARRGLWEWLNAPYNAASEKPPDLQFNFSFG